jgi:nitroreductase
MNDVYNHILGLRAIRDFEDKPLADEDLAAILEAARWTGSSKNRQDWSFIVVTGERLEGLADCGDYTDPVRHSAATLVLVKEEGGNMFDIGRVAQNIMLAAKALGVASCPVTLHRHAEARRFLGAPAGTETRYAVALGYRSPDARARRYGGRRPVEDLVSYQTYQG